MRYLLLLLLTGCATLEPDAVRVEATHISSISQHFASPPTNYGVPVIPSVELHWQHGPVFVDMSEGYNWRYRDGGALPGPGEVFTGRVGYEWRLK
jgi:hypothetical protein